jgi:hypothetical protein
MSKDYRVSFFMDSGIYDDWKSFLVSQGKKPYGNIIMYNTIAMEAGIKYLKANPEYYKSKVKEMENDSKI